MVLILLNKLATSFIRAAILFVAFFLLLPTAYSQDFEKKTSFSHQASVTKRSVILHGSRVFDKLFKSSSLGRPTNSTSSLYATKRTGDLTASEIRQIQNVVNEAGRPLEVVGSAAKGSRRGVGSNLPVGKGPGTKSDIDVLIPPSSKDHFSGLTNKLPDADVNVGTSNPHIGPSIRFEPQ